jgi:hypothetical protein
MCELKDFDRLKLVDPYDKFLREELAGWHRVLGNVRGTVVDMGAGCGETAQYYLNHGAERVVCFENNPRALECLRQNFGNDPRVIILAIRVDHFKSDIEGAEKGSVIETHGPVRFRRLERGTPSPHWRIEGASWTPLFDLRIRFEQVIYRAWRMIRK